MSAVETARVGLCRMIATGELQSGQLLPSEAELCERFAVSRSSLREAQRMLGVAGVLTLRPGERSEVSPMSAKEIMSGLAMVVPLLPLNRFLELLRMREVLEGHVTALAAAKMSHPDSRRLQDLAEQLAQTDPSDRAQRLDLKFHDLIIHNAGDDMMAALLAPIRKRGRDYRVFDGGANLALKAISDQAHRDIAKAIVNRDPESARFLAMEHVRVTRTWLEGIQPSPTLFESDGGHEGWNN